MRFERYNSSDELGQPQRFEGMYTTFGMTITFFTIQKQQDARLALGYFRDPFFAKKVWRRRGSNPRPTGWETKKSSNCPYLLIIAKTKNPQNFKNSGKQ